RDTPSYNRLAAQRIWRAGLSPVGRFPVGEPADDMHRHARAELSMPEGRQRILPDRLCTDDDDTGHLDAVDVGEEPGGLVFLVAFETVGQRPVVEDDRMAPRGQLGRKQELGGEGPVGALARLEQDHAAASRDRPVAAANRARNASAEKRDRVACARRTWEA